MRPHALRSLLLATLTVSILPLTIPFESHAGEKTPPRPIPSVDSGADGDADADAGEVESEGPDRLVDRMRWFRQGRLGADGEIPFAARNRALAQLRENILRKSLGAQPMNLIAGDGWFPVGPSPLLDAGKSFSGRVTAIAVHPTDANTAYVGAAQGGVWKTTDHGVTWAPLTDTQPSLAIGAIAIDPSNPSVVYAGTGEANNSCDSYFGAGILKSINGGATWTVVGTTPFANTSISRIIVHPTNSSILWAANTTGIGGFACNGPPGPASVGVWKSTDAGLSWTRVLYSLQTGINTHTHDLVIHPTDPLILYAGVNHSGIWKTVDGGTTWTHLTTGLPADSSIGRVAVAIHPTNPVILYAIFSNFNNGTQFGGVYKTVTSGATWSLLASSKPTGSCQYWSFQDLCTYSGGTSGQCWYDLVISVESTGAVWIGGTGLWRSTNGAAPWNSVCPSSPSSPNVHPDQHALAVKAGDAWLGNDGGVFTTTNNGGAWTSRNAGLALTQFYPGGALHPTDAAVALGGAQDNGMLYYSGSPTWSLLGTGDGAFNAIDFSNPSVLYMSTQYLNILKYDGLGWSNATNGLTDARTNNTGFVSPFVMCPNDAQTLIAGSNNVWRTTDGAANWSANSPDPLHFGASISALAFAPSTGDCGTYFAGDQWGGVFRTTNSGASWTDLTSALPGLPINDIAVDPNNPAVVIIGLSGFGANHVWRSTDALDPEPTWTPIDAGIPDVPVNAVLIDPSASNVLYLGTDIGIFRSTNGGTTWQVFMGGHPNVAVFDLVANADTGTILSYTHGRGVFKLGTFCSDGDECTTDTYHQILGCQHAAVTCTASDQCHAAGTCDSLAGCSNPPLADGSGCDDGSACTPIDSCQAGVCTGTATVCTALDQCHVAGTCDAQSGICSNPTLEDGVGCNDGDACTSTDSCQAGVCTGVATVCPASDQCHVAGTCDSQTGSCSDPNQLDGTACDDVSLCTAGDVCTGGVCAGTPIVCDDLNPCTDDACVNPLVGCIATNNDANSCDDGNACTADACLAGACTGTTIPVLVVNDSLRIEKTGFDASVSWVDAPGPFNVYRGTIEVPWTYNQTCLEHDVSGPVTDVDIPATGATAYYLVTRKTACGESSLGGTRPNLSPCP